MLHFADTRFDEVVPEPGEFDDEGRALLERVEGGFETVGELYNACKFRAALGEALFLAREANGYLDRKGDLVPHQRGLGCCAVWDRLLHP